MGILDVIFQDTMPRSVLKIKEGKGKPFSRFIGPAHSKLKRITLQSPELYRTTRNTEVVLHPQEVSKDIQHFREFILELTSTFQLPFVCEMLRKVRSRIVNHPMYKTIIWKPNGGFVEHSTVLFNVKTIRACQPNLGILHLSLQLRGMQVAIGCLFSCSH